MKQQVAELLKKVIDQFKQEGILAEDASPNILLENAKDKLHGDYATNLAMMLTKQVGKSPRDVAAMIISYLPASEWVEKVEVAGPGFINFFMKDAIKFEVIGKVLTEKQSFGKSDVGQGQSVLVEYVSANPTGPLHVGHGRGAAYGASVANVLAEAGYQVSREYYVNDAGRQMDILATSTWLRYLVVLGENLVFPSNGYKGDYIIQIAEELVSQQGDSLKADIQDVFANVADDEVKNAEGAVVSGDKERHIDDLIVNAKRLLGDEGYQIVFSQVMNVILSDIREDLSGFGVEFDNWFSERALMDSGVVDAAIEKLQASGKIYEKNGALWFKSTDYGDEKDRVVVRDNGLKTYFASDIAYHFNKFERGFDILIDIWGSDHHGYVPRVKAAMQALEMNADALEVLLVQFAILYRGGEKLSMSTRSGQFVTLRELREEVGTDAARFFYVQRKSEQHMDFDLDLAKSQSNENPVFYIQYAHARICRVFEQATEKGFAIDVDPCLADFSLLTLEHEASLASLLSLYPEIIVRAAQAYEPHQVAYYLKDLAHGLHSYYNACQFMVDEVELRKARFALILAIRQVLKNGLKLLGVSAPESM